MAVRLWGKKRTIVIVPGYQKQNRIHFPSNNARNIIKVKLIKTYSEGFFFFFFAILKKKNNRQLYGQPRIAVTYDF